LERRYYGVNLSIFLSGIELWGILRRSGIFFFSAVAPIPTETQIAIVSAMLRMNFKEGFLGMQILSFSVGLRTAVLSWYSRPRCHMGFVFPWNMLPKAG